MSEQICITKLWTTPPGRVHPNSTGEDAASKYNLIFKRPGKPDITFVINSDVSVPIVNTAACALKLKVMDDVDVKGYHAFSGTIGEGNLNISLPGRVTISEPITSGPKEIQSFTGVGMWYQA